MSEHILIVDDEPALRHMLGEVLPRVGYRCTEAEDGIAALERLRTDEFALVLTDIRMPRMDGLELLGHIVAEFDDIAVVMLTANAEVASAVRALKMGAYDYITKPFDLRTLPHTIARALERRRLVLENRAYQQGLERLVEQRTAELLTTYQQTLRALASALDTRDSETQEHAERVVQYTVTIAREMGIQGTDLRDLEWGAILHDVGKIGVPDHILFKAGKLTPREWVLMKAHPEIGYQMMKDIPFLHGALPVVRHHHERWDGKGYNGGLKGEAIPLGARIFALADVFDALTTERPYKSALPPEIARAEIVKNTGSHFAPQVVEAFVEIYERASSPFQVAPKT